jgi:hypothetical protein
VPLVAPVLLLLRADPALCPWLLPHRRYVPTCAAITLACLGDALHAAARAARVASAARAPLSVVGWSVASPLLIACLVLPSHLSFLSAQWGARAPAQLTTIALGTLCVLPLIWAHTDGQALNASAGLAFSCAQLGLSYAREVEGLRRL